MNKPLITVAIPAYNNEKSIIKTIDSALEQKGSTVYEILIVDDASIDSTPNILKSYANEKIRVVTLDTRIPLIANHNKCLEVALGEYILFCHADDTLEKNAVEFFANKIKQRGFPEKYVTWGHSMFRDYSKKALNFPGFSYNTVITGEYSPILFFYGGLTPSGTLYSRKSFLELDGYIHVDMNSSPSDMTTMLHLALHGFRFEMCDEMIFNRHGASTALMHDNEEGYLNEIDDAFKFFIEKTPKENLLKIIHLAISQKVLPLYFLYAMAQEKSVRGTIKRVLIKTILKNPLSYRNEVMRRVLKRVF